jgi:hypothetical protein
VNIASAHGWFAEVVAVDNEISLLPLTFWSLEPSRETQVCGHVAVMDQVVSVDELEACTGERLIRYVFKDDLPDDGDHPANVVRFPGAVIAA